MACARDPLPREKSWYSKGRRNHPPKVAHDTVTDANSSATAPDARHVPRLASSVQRHLQERNRRQKANKLVPKNLAGGFVGLDDQESRRLGSTSSERDGEDPILRAEIREQ